MQIRFPFRIDGRGRTATTDDDSHIRDLIRQVLFTQPGERVNRPLFGSNLLNLTFASLGEPMQAAIQMSVQAALQQWLGNLVQIQAVTVNMNDSTLQVTVQYVICKTQQPQVASFEQEV